MDVSKALETLGVGLSKILRYSYGGFLLILLASALKPDATGLVMRAVPWQLAALSALVVGAGLYAAHRSLVIPLHHLGLCVLLSLSDNWARDKKKRVPPEESLSPTRWLGTIGVQKWQLMSAYSTLRRTEFFSEQERQKLDVAHAEDGLVVMTAEGLFLAGAYAWWDSTAKIGAWPLFAVGLAFLVASYPGACQHHRLECLRFRKRTDDVTRILTEHGYVLKKR